MRFTMNVLTAPGFVDRAPEALSLMVANVRKEPTSTASFMSQMQAIIGSDRSQIIRNIRKPTLVIHGTDDQLIPVANGRMIAERIPGARLERIAGTGHLFFWEKPDEVVRIVTEFLG
jgi:pimeloyl-ACP methyl ester carboxylesterase